MLNALHRFVMSSGMIHAHVVLYTIHVFRLWRTRRLPMMTSSDPITYDAYVEYTVDGFYTAQLLDLLGCYARGATEAEALQRLDDAIPAYYDWLRSHDDDTPIVKGPFSVRRAELVAAKADGAPGKGVFFENDALPREDNNLDWTLETPPGAFADFLARLPRIPRERLAKPRPT